MPWRSYIVREVYFSFCEWPRDDTYTTQRFIPSLVPDTVFLRILAQLLSTLFVYLLIYDLRVKVFINLLSYCCYLRYVPVHIWITGSFDFCLSVTTLSLPLKIQPHHFIKKYFLKKSTQNFLTIIIATYKRITKHSTTFHKLRHPVCTE